MQRKADEERKARAKAAKEWKQQATSRAKQANSQRCVQNVLFGICTTIFACAKVCTSPLQLKRYKMEVIFYSKWRVESYCLCILQCN